MPFVARSKYVSVAATAAFIVSLSVAASFGALLMASHASATVDRSAMATFVGSALPKSNTWQAVHILAPGCRCSRQLADALILRKRLPELQETVVIAGSDTSLEAPLRDAGFAFKQIPAEEAAEAYHLRGAPWLVFVSPDGQLRYAGGYASTSDAREGYQDIAIWHKLRAGESVSELPTFGCLIGKRMQRMGDPMGLKYRD